MPKEVSMKKKMGFGAILSELEEEEQYIPRSYIKCPECEQEFRSDECPLKEDQKKICSCGNLEIGYVNSSDGKSARTGAVPGFTTVRYQREFPLFTNKQP